MILPVTRFDVLIVGSGHGGAQAAIALRQAKFAGSIGMIGDEPVLPYERPALTKEYLAGGRSFDRLLLRPATFWEERSVVVMQPERVSSLDPARHAVLTHRGRSFEFGRLIWAAGGEPRRLTCPGHDLEGVHVIRTCANVDRLRAELVEARRVVVVGGGYIGLEAAATLAKLGNRVTILETLDRVLARVAGETLSRFFEAEHRAHGVEVRLGAAISGLEGVGGRVIGVRLATGERLPADLVIVGIGIMPSVEPLLAAGARGGNGVEVDEYCQTSLPDVFAIGDCALHRNSYADDRPIRLESVQNANDMAQTVARVITGASQPYRTVPWFWSNQFGLRLQTVGLSAGHDGTVIRGEPSSRSFSVVYLRKGQVIALDCVNCAQDFLQGKGLVQRGAIPPHDRLADATQPLKGLL